MCLFWSSVWCGGQATGRENCAFHPLNNALTSIQCCAAFVACGSHSRKSKPMTDISAGMPAFETPRRDKPLATRFYLAAWRWHFYAGLYVAPFLIMLAFTGLVMLYATVFDGRDGEKITIEPGQAVAALSGQADLATAAVPGSQLVEWIGPMNASGVSVFRVALGDAQTMEIGRASCRERV